MLVTDVIAPSYGVIRTSPSGLPLAFEIVTVVGVSQFCILLGVTVNCSGRFILPVSTQALFGVGVEVGAGVDATTGALDVTVVGVGVAVGVGVGAAALVVGVAEGVGVGVDFDISTLVIVFVSALSFLGFIAKTAPPTRIIRAKINAILMNICFDFIAF